MAMLDTLFAFFILTIIALLAYLKMTNKTLSDFIKEIREVCKGQQEEVVNIP